MGLLSTLSVNLEVAQLSLRWPNRVKGVPGQPVAGVDLRVLDPLDVLSRVCATLINLAAAARRMKKQFRRVFRNEVHATRDIVGARHVRWHSIPIAAPFFGLTYLVSQLIFPARP